MSRRTAQRCIPLEWSLALVGAGILTYAFQGCATAPQPAESPNGAPASSELSEPSGMSELSGVPEPAESPSTETPALSTPAMSPDVGATPQAVALSTTETATLGEPHPRELPRLTETVESIDCDAYAKAQEPLARLGVAALTMGRIDPWIYDFDPATQKLRISASLGGVPAPAARALKQALKQVNDHPTAASLLAQAHSELTQPGSMMLCTPTKYAAVVKRINDLATHTEGHSWQFTGERRPSAVQMVGCFQALYAKVPDSCDSPSYFEQSAKCMTTHMGTFERECRGPLEPVNAGSPSPLAAPGGAAPAPAAARTCCKSCGQYYQPNSGSGGCSSTSC